MAEFQVFISHNSHDKPAVRELVQNLTNLGISVWHDEDQLIPGRNWQPLLEQGIERSAAGAVLVGKDNLGPWENEEMQVLLDQAVDSGKPVIPVLLPGASHKPKLPLFLRNRVWVDLHAGYTEDGIAKLIWGITGIKPETLKEGDKLFQVPHNAPLQKQLSHLEYRANPYFVGRDLTLTQIHEELLSKPIGNLSRGHVRAIVAMGGVGKTTLVRQYAEKFCRSYSDIFWVDARKGYEMGFARIHDLLFSEPGASIGMNERDMAKKALHTLHDQQVRLLIIDNVEDETSVSPWIPVSGGCHTLITSRFSKWSAVIPKIDLDTLSPEEAAEFLRRRAANPGDVEDLDSSQDAVSTDLSSQEATACAVLAEKLGYLPLALEQAAAYIHQQGHGFGFCDYLELYEEAKRELLDNPVLGSTEYPDSVFTTWKPTIAQLQPVAQAIFRFSSLVASTPIPIDLLARGSSILVEFARNFSPETNSIKRPKNPNFWVRQHLGQLTSYSLARQEGHGFTIHPLMQTVEYENLESAEREISWHSCARLLCAGAPVPCWKHDDRREWTIENDRHWALLHPHISRLHQLSKSIEKHKPQGDFELLAIHSYAMAENEEKARAICKEVLATASDNSTTISKQEFLEAQEAFAYLSASRSERLEEFKRLHSLLVDFEGEDAPRTLRALHNVALNTELVDEAEKILRAVIELRTRVLGKDHYNTIDSVHDLGFILMNEPGREEEAEKAISTAIKWSEKNLDPSSPDATNAKTNLIKILRKKGNFADAARLQRDLLEATQRKLGSNHLRCFELMHNLSLFTYNMGKTDEALDLIRLVVHGYEKYLPPDHRDMLTAKQDLGTILGQMGNYEEGEELLREALAGYTRTMGEDDSDTDRTINNLAGLYKMNGKNKEAEELFRRLIENRERTNGPNDTRTLSAILSLAEVLAAKEEKEPERELLKETIQRWKAQDTLDPELGRSLTSYAIAKIDAGEFDDAEGILQVVLDYYINTVGEDDAETDRTIKNLANLYARKGDYNLAEEFRRRLLTIRERVHGSNDTQTLSAILSLGEAKQQQGDKNKARELYQEAIKRWKMQDKIDPALAVKINNLALRKRNAGEFDEAEYLLRTALEVEQQAYPKDHPKLPHRMGNLCFVLILQGNLDQAEKLNIDALHLNGMCGDVTTGRLLFMQLLLSMLTQHDSFESLSNLSKYIAQGKISAQAEIVTKWEISKPLAYLQERLNSEQMELILTLADVLNDPSKKKKLEQLDIWNRLDLHHTNA